MRGILRVLELLGAARQIEPAAAAELRDAYAFLRNAENRLLAQRDLQVHDLPDDELGRARLALAMGHPGWDAFADELARVRATVARHFDAVIGSDVEAPAESVWRQEGEDAAAAMLAAKGFDDPVAVNARLVELRRGAYWRGLGDAGRARLDQLMPAVLEAASSHANADETLFRLLQVIEAIDRRISYLALMIENPDALKHLARLCSASSLVAVRVVA